VKKLNLVDGLNEELIRAKELLGSYENIPSGAFGAMMIRNTIQHAELSMQTQNLAEMIKAYEKLKDLE